MTVGTYKLRILGYQTVA